MSGFAAYRSPSAFRQALTEKLRTLAQASAWTLAQLQRQIAYDRLLERLYVVDDRWIVKGAVALLARDLGVRATIDIDVFREAPREAAEADLRGAASRDIEDWFRFELGTSTAVTDAGPGLRIPVTAYIGMTVWTSFHVDLVGSDLHMTGEPENIPPLARVMMPGVEQHGYRAYPLVDHIADKVVATVERYGEAERPSTRYKDLVDLVAIVRAATVSADSQLMALSHEATRRGVNLPTRFAVPDRVMWERGYAAEAQRSLLLVAPTLDEALEIVRPFLDPLLAGTAVGRWAPDPGEWMT